MSLDNVLFSPVPVTGQINISYSIFTKLCMTKILILLSQTHTDTYTVFVYIGNP